MIIKEKLNIVVPVACIALLMLCSSALAQTIDATSARQINAANELVRAGKVAEAIESYQQVPVDPKLADKLNYNTAVARYRSGDVESAENLFMDSASSADTSIAANSRYNLGNCLYGKAVQLSETDKPAAIENLRDAIDHYRGALRGDPNNPDARANIELAAELIRKLEEEQKQEQQQEQQQQDQQNSEDQSDESDSQKSESQNQDSKKEQNSDEQNSQQENSDQQQSEQKESQGKDSEQSDSQESKENQQDPSEQQGDGESEEKEDSETKQQNQSQPQNKRQQARDQLQPDEAATESEEEANDKPVPTGDLQAADKQGDEQDDNRKPDGSVAMADPNEKDGLMSKEEAMKMLQAVRDRDMLRRLRQEQIERSQHRPVDRDW